MQLRCDSDSEASLTYLYYSFLPFLRSVEPIAWLTIVNAELFVFLPPIAVQ